MVASKSNPTSDRKTATVAIISSGSSEGCNSARLQLPVDEKKRRRLDSNRESARRSRERKQKHVDGLLKEVSGLEIQNKEMRRRIDTISSVLVGYDSQNYELKTLKNQLARQLEALESMIETAKAVRGSASSSAGGIDDSANYNYNVNYNININPIMKPWQLPCPSSLPIFATSFEDFNL